MDDEREFSPWLIRHHKQLSRQGQYGKSQFRGRKRALTQQEKDDARDKVEAMRARMRY